MVAPAGGYHEKRRPLQFYRELLKGLLSHNIVLLGPVGLFDLFRSVLAEERSDALGIG